MKNVNREELSPPQQAALREVEAILGRSHNPYSGLCVGAGLVLQDGEVLTGVNYESASYGLTLCAERTAIARAQTENRLGEIECLVLAARRRSSDAEEAPLTPCGACRQWLAELAARLGRDIPVYTFWAGAKGGLQGSAKALLPEAFQ